MSTLKITYVEEDETQVKKAYDVLMVWYGNNQEQVLSAMGQNPIAVANKDTWQLELDKRVSQIPVWGLGFVAVKGKQCMYNDVVYNITQGHIVDNISFTPPTVPALYRTAPVVLPGQIYPEWNSIGLMDAVNNWDNKERVHWVGKEWESKIDDNIYEPGTVNNTIWEELGVVIVTPTPSITVTPSITPTPSTPNITPSISQSPSVNPCNGVVEWNGSDWATYIVGTKVKVTGTVVELYECIGTTHTWIKPAKTGDGAISWTYLQDCP